MFIFLEAFKIVYETPLWESRTIKSLIAGCSIKVPVIRLRMSLFHCPYRWTG